MAAKKKKSKSKSKKRNKKTKSKSEKENEGSGPESSSSSSEESNERGSIKEKVRAVPKSITSRLFKKEPENNTVEDVLSFDETSTEVDDNSFQESQSSSSSSIVKKRNTKSRKNMSLMKKDIRILEKVTSQTRPTSLASHWMPHFSEKPPQNPSFIPSLVTHCVKHFNSGEVKDSPDFEVTRSNNDGTSFEPSPSSAWDVLEPVHDSTLTFRVSSSKEAGFKDEGPNERKEESKDTTIIIGEEMFTDLDDKEEEGTVEANLVIKKEPTLPAEEVNFAYDQIVGDNLDDEGHRIADVHGQVEEGDIVVSTPTEGDDLVNLEADIQQGGGKGRGRGGDSCLQ